MKHLGDITKIDGATIPAVDVITFGAPCQDLSVAGLRKGMLHADLGDEETSRSGLFMDAVRIIKEMRENEIRSGRTGVHVRPRYAIYENVPGAFSSNGGKDWQTVLTELVRIVCPDAPAVPLPDRGGGTRPDASTMKWEDGPLPIASTMLSGGAFHKDAAGCVSFAISAASQRPKFYLTLNFGEKPRVPNPTKLSEILEPDADPKYRLSAKACQGILNRAERRGKELPKALLDALTEQARSVSKNEPDDLGGQRNPLAE